MMMCMSDMRMAVGMHDFDKDGHDDGSGHA